MQLSEFLIRFGTIEAEQFATRFPHPFLLENTLELASRRVYLVRGAKGNPLLVGRGTRCHIPIRDRRVSSKHAELIPPESEGRSWHLVDLGSTNGTFVDGRKVEEGDPPTPILQDSLLGFGPGVHFRFLTSAAFYEEMKLASASVDEPPVPTPEALETEVVEKLSDGTVEVSAVPTPASKPVGVVMLLCDAIDPVHLQVGSRLILGRKPETAQIVLAHKQVSRRHVELHRRPDGVFIRDLGSANGTFVDSCPIEREWWPLSIGQLLEVGPYQLQLTGPQTSTTAASLATLVVQPSAKEGVKGDLEEVSLSDILHEIEDERHSGVLEVHGAQVTGRLSFQSGLPFSAETDDGHHGEAAVQRLLKQTRGTWLLLPHGKMKEERNLSRTFSDILLDGFLLE